MDINFNEIKDDVGLLPAGDYACKVAIVRESQSPAGHVRWGCLFEVIEGEHQGRNLCWDSLHFSEKGLSRVRFAMEAMGLAANPDGNLTVEPTDLEGKTVMVTVAVLEGKTGVASLKVPYAGYASLKPDASEIDSEPPPL